MSNLEIEKTLNNIKIFFKYNLNKIYLNVIAVFSLLIFSLIYFKWKEVDTTTIILFVTVFVYLFYLSVEGFLYWYKNKVITFEKDESLIIVNNKNTHQIQELKFVLIQLNRGKYFNGWDVYFVDFKGNKTKIRGRVLKKDAITIANLINEMFDIAHKIEK